jgi:hypothetical protein
MADWQRPLAIREKQALALEAQPTTLRRCLGCEWWFRSTGPDHRICNCCKGDYRGRSIVGHRISPGERAPLYEENE